MPVVVRQIANGCTPVTINVHINYTFSVTLKVSLLLGIALELLQVLVLR